jgi:ATP-dependent Clp protease protease subunit
VEKENFVRFVGKVTARSRNALLRALDSAVRERVDKLHLVMSASGGSVTLAASLCNYLQGVPVEIHTYNFGLVSTAGLVLFCAGSRRFCTTHARFVVGCPDVTIHPNTRLGEAGLEEALRSLRLDQERMAEVMAEATGTSITKVRADVKAEVVLDPRKAVEYGLVHEIRPVLFPKGVVPYSVSETGDSVPSPGGGEPAWGEGA